MSIASWFVRLTLAGKLVLLAFVGALFLPAFVAGAVLVAAVSGASTQAHQPSGESFASAPDPGPSQSPAPKVTTDKVIETVGEPFSRVTVEDATVAAGVTSVTTVGAPGTRAMVYLVTYIDGVEASRELVSDEVIIAPLDEVTTIGTYVAPPPPAPVPFAAPAGGCDPNYSSPCVPIASDVDCAGGSGNGPAYVTGPVRISGTDIYDLDRDGDGIACDK